MIDVLGFHGFPAECGPKGTRARLCLARRLTKAVRAISRADRNLAGEPHGLEVESG